MRVIYVYVLVVASVHATVLQLHTTGMPLSGSTVTFVDNEEFNASRVQEQQHAHHRCSSLFEAVLLPKYSQNINMREHSRAITSSVHIQPSNVAENVFENHRRKERGILTERLNDEHEAKEAVGKNRRLRLNRENMRNSSIRRSVGGRGDDVLSTDLLELSNDGERIDFQIHGHEGPRTYVFGFDTGDGKSRQYRLEERRHDGTVKGQYGYYDAKGKLRIVKYAAIPSEGYQERHHERTRDEK